MPEPVRYAEGLRDFLIAQIQPILPDLNADLAAKVDGGFAPFALVVGSVPNVAAPRLALSWVDDSPQPAGNTGKLITVRMKIECLVPVAGNNTSSNFETARMVSHAWIQSLLDDETKMLTPYINAGGIGNVHGMNAAREGFRDIFPRLMADGKTFVRGWQVFYAATFSLQTR